MEGDGVELHFLSIRRVLKPEHTFADVLQIGLEIDRGNSESHMRSRRLAATWAEKKHHSEKGIAISNKMPGWLEGKIDPSLTRVIRSKTKEYRRYTVNKRKAKVVQRIFEMTADGQGKRLIARQLNQKKVPTFGRAAHWGQSYVQKILHNRAVLGEYAPHKGRGRHRQPDGEPRLEFYPPIITADLWQGAHRAIASRRTTSQKGKITGKYSGQARHLNNLFQGLVFDANQNLPMYHSDRGKRDRPRLISNSKEVYGSKPNSVVYADFERAFLTWWDALDWSTIADIAASDAIKKMEKEVAELQLSISRAEAKIKTLVDAFLTLSSPAAALNDRMRELESQVAADKVQLEREEGRLTEARNKFHDFHDPAVFSAAMAQTTDLETHARLRQEIRRKVTRIYFWFHRDEKTPQLVPDPKNDLFPFARIEFANGEKRFVVMLDDGQFLTFQPKDNDYKVVGKLVVSEAALQAFMNKRRLRG